MESKQVYSESFKRMVVEEQRRTGCSKSSLLIKYGIRFRGAIQTWEKQLGYRQSVSEKRRFGGQTESSVPKNKKNETRQDLQRRIRDLERQLEDEQLRAELYERMIEKAEKEYKLPIRKKPDTK